LSQTDRDREHSGGLRASLHNPYTEARNSEWIVYALWVQRSASHRRRSIMLDIAFVVIGTLFLAVMGVYADACRRL
jgi:hypothetical protein